MYYEPNPRILSAFVCPCLTHLCIVSTYMHASCTSPHYPAFPHLCAYQSNQHTHRTSTFNFIIPPSTHTHTHTHTAAMCLPPILHCELTLSYLLVRLTYNLVCMLGYSFLFRGCVCCRPYPREPNGSLSRRALKSLLGVCVVCVCVWRGIFWWWWWWWSHGSVILLGYISNYCHLWGWVMWVNRTDQLEFILL